MEKGASRELINRLKKMHLFLYEYMNFDESMDDNDDLEQVLKDAYRNFTSNFEEAMDVVDSLLQQYGHGPGSIYFSEQFNALKEEMRFLRTSFRCMITKCCIGIKKLDKSMNEALIHHLGRVEAEVVKVAAYFGDYVNSSPSEDLELRLLVMASDMLTAINGLKEDIGAAYSVIVTESSPVEYFTSRESIEEFLDQVLENFNDLLIQENMRTHTGFDEMRILTEDLSFMRSLLQFAKDRIESEQQLEHFLISIEAVADKAAHISFLRWTQKTNSLAFYQMKKSRFVTIDMNLLKLGMYNRIWKASSLGLTIPLTDELLIGFVDLLSHHLTLLIEYNGANVALQNKVEVLCDGLSFLRHFLVDPVNKHFVEKENLYKLKLEVQDMVREVCTAVLSFDGKGDIRKLFSLVEKKVGHLKHLIMQLENTPLSDELSIRFLDFLYINLIELPKVYEAILNGETKDQLAILGEELCFLRHILRIQEKNYVEKVKSWDLTRLINVIVRKIGSVVCPHFNDVKKENNATAIMSFSLSELLKNIRLIKALVIQLEDAPLKDQVLIAFVDCLHNNVIDLLKDRAASLSRATKDQFQMLNQDLGFLRRFVMVQIKDYCEQEKLHGLRIEMEAVARKMGSIIHAYYFSRERKENLAPTISEDLYDLPRKTRHMKTSAILLQDTPLSDELLIGFVDCLQNNLIELLKDEAATLTSPMKDQLEILSKELEFLKIFLINHPPEDYPPKLYAKQEKFSDVKLHLEVVTRKMASAMHSSFSDETKGNLGFLPLSDLIENLKLVKEEVMEIIFLMDLHRIRKKFPETNLLGFLNSLVENLKELICSKSDMIADWNDQIQTIHDDLDILRSYLQKITDNHIVVADLKDLSNRIRIAAYEAEYLINSFVVEACPVWCRSLWISGLLEQIKLIKGAAMDNLETKAENANDLEINVVDKKHSQVLTQSLVPTTDRVVGFEDELDRVKQMLASDRRELDLISIVGMPGLGKTTLAKKVYEDRLIVDHFYVRAWCNVSQEYQKRELLLNILSSIVELTDVVRKTSDENLALMLHKELMGRRYLVVLDDVWSTEAWEDLKRLFPNNDKGSRIMLTSRNKLSGAKYHSDPLELRFLTDNESWDLFQWKVHGEDKCPQELCQVGKEIAVKCKGLPLALVVVAGLLSKSEMKRGFWEEVAGNLSSFMARDTERQWIDVLELSYKLLPDHLKPLFLYLGVFPEDKEIPAKKLIWFWIAEGFVRKTKLQNLEFQAEFDLKDLIDRSLVIVAERRYNGRVKTCRVHDLIRDLCLAKAKEENFMQQIHSYGELSNPVLYGLRRLNACLQKKPENIVSPSIALKDPTEPIPTSAVRPMSSIVPPLQSLLIFHTDKHFQMWYDAIKSTLSNSKLLRLLHSESTTMGEDFCPTFVKLDHIRYASLRVSWNSIPSSISNCWNLEALIIKGSKGEIEVPDAIWKMAKLRHLHVNDRAAFKLGAGGPQISSKLEKLETLSTPTLSYGEEKQLLRKFPNLKKLRCIFLGLWDPFRKCNHFPQLELLDQLQSLKVFNHGRVQHPSRFYLPSNLRKLTLSKFRLKWKDVSSFQNLPSLEVLKLLFGAVEDEVWNMGDVQFPKLKYLKFERLNIKQWDASEDSFPLLEKTVLERCKQLKEIPSSLGYIDSLERIEVLWCSTFAVKSAMQIQEEQEDMGNPLLKVHIYPPSLDCASST